jgi:branched-chain amino acid transport system ATP-binding protein
MMSTRDPAPAPRAPVPALLDASDIVVGYQGKQVLHGVSLHVGGREIVGVIGHNGAGKSTLLKALFGVVPVDAGDVRFDGTPITNRDAARNAASGVAFVPQARGLFAELTVADNLRLGGYLVRDARLLASRLETVHALFPILRQRAGQIAGSLSGGEQQMVALGLALMRAPRLLLLDEPSLGLSPAMIDRVLDSVRAIRERLGTSVLIAEQNVKQLFRIADRVYGLRVGRVVVDGPTADLDDARLRELF